MEQLTAFILPTVIISILLFALTKGIAVFDCFIEGAKGGISTFIKLIPPILALIVMVSMLNASGALTVISRMLSPITNLLGIPEEVTPLCLISPLSGSGSITMFEQILSTYGADSFVGRVASVISGSTETSFYAIAVYFGAVGIKKTKYTVFSSLFADMTSFALSALMVRLLFY